jgi:cell wall-associated NlpC family hydrolase
MDWMLEFVGIPYLDGGNTINGLDCYGLYRLVLKRGLGVELPEKPIGWRRYGIILSPRAKLQRYDAPLFSSNSQGLVDHLGAAVDSYNFLHADRLCGQVVCDSLSRAGRKIKAIGRPFAAMKNDS